MTDTVRLRFVQGSEFTSRLIELRETTVQPITPSHVELVVPEGYLGALLNGGVQIRPVGYDKGTYSGELFVDVPCNSDAAIAFARSKLKTPYDWKAILNFIVPVNLHLPNDCICSALVSAALAAGNAFAGALAAPLYLISPRDVLLIVSALVKIP